MDINDNPLANLANAIRRFGVHVGVISDMTGQISQIVVPPVDIEDPTEVILREHGIERPMD